jgi:hypothetical protein
MRSLLLVALLAVPAFAQSSAVDLPPNDTGKFFVTIYSQPGCVACDKLVQDWKNSPSLKAFAVPDHPSQSWAHFTIIKPDSALAANFKNANPPINQVPTIVVQPPKNGDYGPETTTIFRKTGYEGKPGDTDRLAGDIAKALKKFVGIVKPTVPDQQVTPFNPLAPTPAVNPVPTPQIPPAVDPAVEPTPDPNTDGPYPDYPQAILILDESGLKNRIKARLADFAIEQLSKKLGIDTAMFTMDWEEAQEKGYPLTRDQIPAVVISNKAKLTGMLTVSVLEAFKNQDAAVVPATPAEPTKPAVAETPEEIPFPAFPIGAIPALFMGGGIVAAVPLGIWGLRVIRRRRKLAGKTQLLPDEAFDFIEKLIGDLTNDVSTKEAELNAKKARVAALNEKVANAAGKPAPETVA